MIVITIAANRVRYESIIRQLEPVVQVRKFLTDAVFLRVEPGNSIVWRNERPFLVSREAIVISGSVELGINFDTYQSWRAILQAEFKKATGLPVTAI